MIRYLDETQIRDRAADQGISPAIVSRLIAMIDQDAGELEIEFSFNITGGYYRQTLESPAEYPEAELNGAYVYDVEVDCELAFALLELCGGSDLEVEAVEDAEKQADADYGEYLADCMEYRR